MPKNSYIFILLLLTIFNSILSTCEIAYLPTNTIFTFDINNVILEKKFFIVNRLTHSKITIRKPIHGTIQLIKMLKNKGYPLHIFSNCSDTVFNILKLTFSDIFGLFDDITTQDSSKKLKKPHPHSFENYLIMHNPHRKKVIFIDDKEENINVARSYKIVGLRFHSPEQLQEDLQNLNIINKENYYEV